MDRSPGICSFVYRQPQAQTHNRCQISLFSNLQSKVSELGPWKVLKDSFPLLYTSYKPYFSIRRKPYIRAIPGQQHVYIPGDGERVSYALGQWRKVNVPDIVMKP